MAPSSNLSTPSPHDPLWVFGYGSLIWKPDLPAVEVRRGLLSGRGRRFWQGSPDHRGTPSAPGRVLTLIDAPGEACVGLVFRVAPDAALDTLAALERREQAGYACETHVVDTAEGPVEAITYVARPHNPDWLGPAPVEAIAARALKCEGPSGTNRAYVLRLDAALRTLEAPPGHVREVADALRHLEASWMPT